MKSKDMFEASKTGACYTPTILGHRPLCALSASARYAEFPREERLNSLRSHLVRYGLFPPRRDPETAPITMQELKGLVRIWKLHNERNFWRNHTTKDEIVSALHAHMQKKIKLEQLKKEIVAKGRQKRSDMHAAAAGHGHSAMSHTHHSKSKAGADGFGGDSAEASDGFKRRNSKTEDPHGLLHGDGLYPSKDSMLTGMGEEGDADYVPAHEREERPEKPTHNNGMIYLSRGFADTTHRVDPRSPEKVPGKRTKVDYDHEEGEAASEAATHLSKVEDVVEEDNDLVIKEREQQMRVKRKCSNALLNMSCNDTMQSQFIEQGGLAALLELAISCSDEEVVTNCAACLVNLIPYGDYYSPRRLLEAGVVRVLVRLALGHDPRVRHYCALCLCRLSAERGLEEWLIADGALAAATRLVTLSENASTKEVAAKVLINLAVTLEGNQAETLVKNVLKCVANLVGHFSQDGTSEAGTQQFCAEAIASLACLGVARPILAKQGVISVLKMVLMASVRTETTNACAAALCNMGQLHGCRKEMLALGLIRIMSRLLRSGTNETQHLCTLCLTTLSFQKDLRGALLKEGALRTIGTVVARRTDPELTRQGAYALLNFAFDPQTREDVITEDALPALMALLDLEEEALKQVDEATRANSLMALCNLLADPATCPQVLEAGVLLKLVGFTRYLDTVPSLHEYLAVALLNLSIHTDVRPYVARTPGCVDLLLELAIFGIHASAKHANSLTAGSRGSDSSRATKALKTLFNLGMDPQSHEVLLSRALRLSLLDAIGELIGMKAAPAADDDLSSMESHGSRPGKPRRKYHGKKKKEPVASYDSNSSQHLCAMLLHVLTTNQENHDALLSGGAVLLLVKLSASPNEVTKTAVAGSLYNLTQCAPVAHEAFLGALMSLSHSSENARVLWCAWCFANVSTYPKGRAMLGKLSRKLIPTLLAMMRSGCADAERIQYHCSVAMCNTLSVFLKKEDVLAMLKEGTVQDVIVITVLRANDVRTKQVLAQALFNLLARVDTRSEMIRKDVPLALVRLTKVEDPILNLLCVNMLRNLSCEAETLCTKLLEMKVVRVMVDQCLSPSGGVQIKRRCATTLGNLSRVPAMLKGLAAPESGIVAGIRSIAVAQDAETLENMGAVAFHLSEVPEGRESLTQQGATPVLVNLCAGDETPVRVRQLVIASLCNMSTYAASHRSMAEHSMKLLIETMSQPVQSLDTRMNACVAMCNLVVHYPASRETAVQLDLMPALKQLIRACTTDAQYTVLAKIVRDLTWYADGLPVLAAQGAMALCVRLAKREPPALKHDVATAVGNLCSCKFAPPQLIEEGAVGALFWLTLQDCLNLTRPIFRECSIAIRYLAQHETLMPLICMENNLLPLLLRLAKFMECEETRYDSAVALYHILGNEPSQKSVCRSGAVKVLTDLAATGERVREVCSAALHQLPNGLLQHMDGQLLSVLMSLLQIHNADFTDPEHFRPDRSFASTHEWLLAGAQYAHPKRKMVSEWPTSVIEKSVNAFVPARYAIESYPGEQVNPSRARGTTDFIGSYSKMRAPCSQQTASNLQLSLLGAPAPGETTEVEKAPETAPLSSFLELAPPPVPSVSLAPPAPKSLTEAVEEKADANSDPDVADAPRARLPAIHARAGGHNKFMSEQSIAASDALAKSTIRAAFRRDVEDAATEAAAQHRAAQDAIPGALSPIPEPVKRKNPRKYLVAKKMKQKDRISDDYYELLRHVA